MSGFSLRDFSTSQMQQPLIHKRADYFYPYTVRNADLQVLDPRLRGDDTATDVPGRWPITTAPDRAMPLRE